MWQENGNNYKWQYDYAQLANEKGFFFEKHKRSTQERAKICLIDIEQIVRDRDTTTVENCLPVILRFSFDPDQANLLDPNFVKIFRLSQLAVEYLSFCKRTLDGSLGDLNSQISTLKDENRELKLFVGDLQKHISTLIRKKSLTNCEAFKCPECQKVFSTASFLQSHQRRRHCHDKKITPSRNRVVTDDEDLDDVNSENIHLEIKSIKGRLNSAEKLLLQDTSSSQTQSTNPKQDLNKKLEDLKSLVEVELRKLQRQQKDSKKSQNQISARIGFDSKSVCTETVFKRESCTQTNCSSSAEELVPPNSEEIWIKIQEFEASLESKVYEKLSEVDSKMQGFLTKFELDKQKKIIEKPPQPKPRRNLQMKDKETTYEPPPIQIRKIARRPSGIPIFKRPIVNQIQEKPIISTRNEIAVQENEMSLTSSTSSSSSGSTEVLSKSEEFTIPKANFKPPTKESVERIEAIEMKPKGREEIEIQVESQLKTMGIDARTRQVPQGVFKKALKIIQSKAKKTFPNYEILRKRFDDHVDSLAKQKVEKPKAFFKTRKGLKPKSKDEEIPQQDSNTFNDRKLEHFAAVVEEIRAISSDDDEEEDDEDEDRSTSVEIEEIVAQPVESIPSTSGVTKSRKRVLFDLHDFDESHTEKQKNPVILQRTNEAEDTSASSSVFSGIEVQKSDKSLPQNQIQQRRRIISNSDLELSSL